MTGRGSPADAMRTSDAVALMDSPGAYRGRMYHGTRREGTGPAHCS